MLDEKDIRFLREIFSSYNYIMTTAQLDAERLFYRDIQRMLEAGVIEKVKSLGRGLWRFRSNFNQLPFPRCRSLYGNGTISLRLQRPQPC